MKTKNQLFFLLLSFLLMSACNSKVSVFNATGLAYEVVVVMDEPLWKGEVGEAVKNELTRAIPGLFQEEPSMKISYCQPHDFNGMMKYVRNVLIVKSSDSNYTKFTMKMSNDEWAKGQLVITLTAPDQTSIVEYLNDHQGALVEIYNKEEMKRMASYLSKTYSTVVMEKLNAKFDVSMNVPSDITSYKDTIDFFWASNDANTGRVDVVVYTFPYKDKETFTKEYLVAMRDSILGANIPGSFPNSYMATEQLFVEYSPKTLRDKYCGVLRGHWKMEGDMMGGPFVSYARLDEVNQRVVVAEGFVYAPEMAKGKLIRRLEAALHTLRLPNEGAKSNDEN